MVAKQTKTYTLFKKRWLKKHYSFCLRHSLSGPKLGEIHECLLQFSPSLLPCLTLAPAPLPFSLRSLGCGGSWLPCCEQDCVAGNEGLRSIANDELRPGETMRVSLEVDSSAPVGPRDDWTPYDSLTTILWNSLSQNHSAKLHSDSWRSSLTIQLSLALLNSPWDPSLYMKWLDYSPLLSFFYQDTLSLKASVILNNSFPPLSWFNRNLFVTTPNVERQSTCYLSFHICSVNETSNLAQSLPTQ